MSPWWLRILRYAVPHWRGVLALASLSALTVAFELARPWPLTLIVDHVLKGDGLPALLSPLSFLPGATTAAGLVLWLGLAQVALFVVHWACKGAFAYLEADLGNRMTYSFGADLFAHLQELSIHFHNRRGTGDLVKRVTGDTHCVRDLVISLLLPMVISLMNLGSMIFVMWRLDATIAAVVLVITLLLLLVVVLFSGPMQARALDQLNAEGDMFSHAEQSLRVLPMIQIFGLQAAERSNFARLTRRTSDAYVRSTVVQVNCGTAAGFTTGLGTALVLWLGGQHVMQGQLTVGALLAFLSYLTTLYAPVETLAYLTLGYANAAASAQRALTILDVQERVVERPDARMLPLGLPGLDGSICLERVTFGHDHSRPVLSEVSMKLKPGERVALVGPSGAGKSTLISLIPRFHDAWSGRVLVDGHDVRDVTLSSLRANISLVLQDPFLLSMSIAENIAYGRPTASMEEIRAAAVAANADEFIAKLPEGYDTVIGERGATLSGGQRQRLSIARALLKNAPILILDEPTSALDPQTEQQIMDALGRLMKGRTTLIIAHRLSLAQRADRILVMDQGQIVEAGSHEELLAQHGLYAQMSRNQNADLTGVGNK